MPRVFIRLLVVLACGWARLASADLIEVNGLEWLQPADFQNLSWNDVNTVCDATSGYCNGSLNGNDITGWTWASVDDVNVLFNHYVEPFDLLGPGPDYAYQALGTDWLSDMVADGFVPTYQTSVDAAITAATRTLDQYVQVQLGFVMYKDNSPFQMAFTGDVGNLGDCDCPWDKNTSEADTGMWFVRDTNATAVPITSTVTLVALGLCAILFAGRKRTHYT